MKLRIFLAAGLMGALTLVFPRAARADAMVVFDASGELLNTSELSGTITIDTTNGDVTAADLSLSAPESAGPFTFDSQGVYNTHDYLLTFEDPSGDLLSIDLPEESLVGYTGTEICVSNAECPPDPNAPNSGVLAATNPDLSSFFTSGALTESVAPAPEPSTTVPLIAGVLGLVAGIKRERARPAA